MLDARIGKAWSEYLNRGGTKTTLNQHLPNHEVRPPLGPTIALWPDWLPDSDKLRGLRKAFGFMPLPSHKTMRH